MASVLQKLFEVLNVDSATVQFRKFKDELVRLEQQREKAEEYTIALQRAIEYHCNGMLVDNEIAKNCPHHAALLNENLKNTIFRKELE